MNEQLVINMPPQVEEILGMLKGSGYEAYAVGGCIRDSLLGSVPNDWDICTSAKPEETKGCFGEYHVIETGLKHGTVTVVINSEPYEITTYRVDGEYKDNRRPEEVLFVTNLSEDLARRDFTINALAYNHEDGLQDYYEGQKDLNAKIIRCVGDANKRFQEDALRILRALRFASVLGFKIEEGTAKAIREEKVLLKNIAKERIQVEIVKLLLGDGAKDILMEYSDVLSVIIPEIKGMVGCEQYNPHHCYDVWEHTLTALQYTPKDKVLRLATLLHDSGKPKTFTRDEQGVGHFYGHGAVSQEIAYKVMNDLRFDNETKHDVCQLVKHHDGIVIGEPKYVKRWLNKLGLEQFKRLLKIKYADMMGQSEYEREAKLAKLKRLEEVLEIVLSEEQCFSLKHLAVNGRDLINMGVKDGKKIGRILDKLLEEVIDGKIDNQKEVLLGRVSNI